MSDSNYKIITNNQYRELLYSCDIPESVLSDYDHLSEDDNCYGWFKYKTAYYHTSDFLRFNGKPYGEDWHGYNDSGLIIGFNRSNDGIKIGRVIHN